MQFFAYAHLPAHLQQASRPFGELADRIVETLPRNPERAVALRKLLEAKDAAVRALDASFAPSATKHTLVMYTFNLDCDNDETSTVELRSDAADPPTTVRASAHLTASDPGAATPKVVARQQLVYVVPPAHFVKLVTSGTGAATIAHQTEMVIS